MTRKFSVLAAAATLSFLAVPAHAQTFRELMEDVGIQKRKQEKMDFSERAPLVLPPSLNTLPPPEDSASLAAVNPNWPTDPDSLKEQEEAEQDKIPQRFRRKYQEDAARDIYKERAQHRENGAFEGKPRAYETATERGVMTPDELTKVRDQKAADAVTGVPVAIVEPERKRLTDPPEGYRVPSAEQPYGPGEKGRKGKGWLSKLNPFTPSEDK
jgi:hypothetical protein